jgi:hypothetical protein
MARPKIVTASWYTQLPAADLFTSAPESYCRIGISRGSPRGQSGFRMYRKLQPGPGTLRLPPAEFTSHYLRDVLGKLDAQQVVDELLELADGKTPALCCFEQAHGPAWCHPWHRLRLAPPDAWPRGAGVRTRGRRLRFVISSSDREEKATMRKQRTIVTIGESTDHL